VAEINEAGDALTAVALGDHALPGVNGGIEIIRQTENECE